MRHQIDPRMWDKLVAFLIWVLFAFACHAVYVTSVSELKWSGNFEKIPLRYSNHYCKSMFDLKKGDGMKNWIEPKQQWLLIGWLHSTSLAFCKEGVRKSCKRHDKWNESLLCYHLIFNFLTLLLLCMKTRTSKFTFSRNCDKKGSVWEIFQFCFHSLISFSSLFTCLFV